MHAEVWLRGEALDSDPLKHLVLCTLQQAREGCVMAYKFKGLRFDCGSIDGFVDATNYCYEHFYKAGDP